EILRIKGERINKSIPADDVERMMRHRYHSPARAVFDQNFGVAFFVDRVQLSWPVQIALGIGRAHFDLTFFIYIALRNSDRPDGFENQIILLLHLVGHELVSYSARNPDVILGAITLLTEARLECA